MPIKKIPVKKWVAPLVMLFVVGLAMVVSFECTYSGRYYPGVSINGLSVSGKTHDQVLQELTEKSDTLLKNGLKLEFKGKTTTSQVVVPSSAIGFTADTLVEYFSFGDLAPAAASAYAWGRQGSILQRLRQQLSFIYPKNFSVPVLTQREAIQSLISRETNHHFTAQVPAHFSFDKNGKAIIIDEIPSENLDINIIMDAAVKKINTFDSGPITFTLNHEIPYTTKEKLLPLLSLAQTLFATPGLTFSYARRTWHVSGKTLATWLTLNPDNQITVDHEKLTAFLDHSAGLFIDNPPQNSRFAISGGQLTEISKGTPGSTININQTKQLIESAISNIQKTGVAPEVIAIKTITTNPAITQETITQYHIKELIGRATTNFTGGSADRQRNIEVGASKITGLIIAPGEEFSTVNAIGVVSEKAGFVKEYVINGNQTVKELGGGLCQIATTLFRTAISAGMPITERVNHKYVIPYYGPGLDATIYGPHPDFRFVNDTGNYLLLQGIAKNNEVTFELYGVSDGRTVTVSKPRLSNEKPVPADRLILSPTLPVGKTTCTIATHKGVTADATYTVNYLNGASKETIFHSVYQPWPRVCLVGTAPR